MTAVRHLPRPLSAFVGRTADVQAVVDLLAESRVVSVVGPGGSGKTRVAIEAARRWAAEAKDGSAHWVELAELVDEAAVPSAVADVVGAVIDPRRGAAASLPGHFDNQLSLLCLDNAEHLVESVASLAGHVVETNPGLTVLVTSREPLGLPGEMVWRLPPMIDEEAAELFVKRAAAVRPAYQPDASERDVIGGIVRHLDGIPLAIELAAAWLGTLSPQQVLAGLDDRFRLLVRGPRNAARRHQTLAGSIGWSHALLDETERGLLRRVSVFRGSFSLDAAVAVAAGTLSADEALPALGRLVDKSLVMAEHSAGPTRYRLLETVRAFMWARLVAAHEDHDVRERHLLWCTDFAERTAERHRGYPERIWAGLRPEYAELRAALDCGLDQDNSGNGRRLAAALAWFWHLDRHGYDGIRFLRRAIDASPYDRSALQARLLTGLSLVADTTSPLDLEYDAATAAVEIATELGERDLRGLCLVLAAVGAAYTDFDLSHDLADQAMAAAPDDEFVQAAAQAMQAIVLQHRDRHDVADGIFQAVRPRLREVHRGVESTAACFEAAGALSTGDAPRALGLAEEALSVAEPLGDYLRVGIARSTLAVVQATMGCAGDAAETLAPLLRLVEGADDDVFVPGLAHAVGIVAVARGDLATAADWFRRDAAATDRGVVSWLAATSLADLGATLVASGDTDEAAEALRGAAETATRLNMPRVLATALSGQAEIAAMDPNTVDQAMDLDHQALALRVDHGLRGVIPDSLEAIARYRAAARPSLDDVRVFAAADAARDALGIPRNPTQDARWASSVAMLRANLGDSEVEAAWTEGEQLHLDAAIAYVRRSRGQRRRPSSGWSSLTPTEREVTALVAEGLNNPQIAARLLMGRGTVKTHLGHIFAKLGVANRTELAAFAMAHSTDAAGGSAPR